MLDQVSSASADTTTHAPKSSTSSPASGSNAASRDDLREAFFRECYDTGKTVGEGKQAITDFAIQIAAAARDGIIEHLQPKQKAGESDAAVAYGRYLEGTGKTLSDVVEANKDSAKKQVAYFERFIKLGKTMGDSGEDAADLLRRGRSFINDYAKYVADEKAKDKDADVTPIPGGTYNNLYKLAGEQLAKDDTSQGMKYVSNDGESLRAMTDDEIRSALVPDAPTDKTELDRCQQLCKQLEDLASKFQDSPYESLHAQAVERLSQLQQEALAAEGVELKSPRLLTQKDFKQLVAAHRVASRF